MAATAPALPSVLPTPRTRTRRPTGLPGRVSCPVLPRPVSLLSPARNPPPPRRQRCLDQLAVHVTPSRPSRPPPFPKWAADQLVELASPYPSRCGPLTDRPTDRPTGWRRALPLRTEPSPLPSQPPAPSALTASSGPVEQLASAGPYLTSLPLSPPRSHPSGQSPRPARPP